MTKQEVILYAKYVAVGNGTLTKAMNDRLMAGDSSVATDIMEGRIRQLLEGKVGGLGADVTEEDIGTMVASVREAIDLLNP
jgi:hypothetical protein